MKKIRERIVQLSKELAECEDEATIRKIRRQIAILKEQLPPTEPTQIGKIM